MWKNIEKIICIPVGVCLNLIIKSLIMKKIIALFLALVITSTLVLLAQFNTLKKEMEVKNVSIEYNMKLCFLKRCCKPAVGYVCIVRDKDLAKDF